MVHRNCDTEMQKKGRGIKRACFVVVDQCGNNIDHGCERKVSAVWLDDNNKLGLAIILLDDSQCSLEVVQ